MAGTPVRIIKIETKNFRAFGSRPLVVDLTKSGKNLLVYGENGSGKSSLFFALKDFLECASREASQRNITVFPYRNIFAASNSGYVRLELTGLPRPASQSKAQKKKPVNKVYEWSNKKDDTGDQLILEVDKTKGFIDYKALLATYFLQQDRDTVDIFQLLINNILKHVENDIGRKKFGEEWSDINEGFRTVKYTSPTQKKALVESIQNFNNGLTEKLKELRTTAKRLLDFFKYDLDIEFNFRGAYFGSKEKRLDPPIVGLKVTFFASAREDHHLFLNEAKLSAIAISIFFAALLLQPASRLRILALDDVLIGLDMSNRLPVLDILRDEFGQYQIFFFTYDKAWYEIVKQRVGEKDWKHVEFYAGNTDKHDLPIVAENGDYYSIAADYLSGNDFKAAMVYLRTYFEYKLKRFCEKKSIPVIYHTNAKDFTAENFWEAVKKYEQSGGPLLDDQVVTDLETYRSIAINPLCHASFAATHLQEVTDAMQAVKNVTDKLA